MRLRIVCDKCRAYSARTDQCDHRHYKVFRKDMLMSEMCLLGVNLRSTLEAVMVDRYGTERFLRDSKAERVQQDDYGTLYVRKFISGTPAVFIHLTNSTAEADGSRREFWRRVHPELRPLLGDGQLGEPQAMTAHNAVASTYGMRGEEYAPSVQT